MSLEIKLNNIENELSYYSLYPIILPGVAKIGLGVTQMVSAIAISLVFSVSASLNHKSSQKNFFLAVKHIKHGIGNILAGSLEAIPLVGTVCFVVRQMRLPYSRDTQPRLIMKHPRFKFIPYDHNTEDLFLKEKKEFLSKYLENYNFTASQIQEIIKDRF